MSKFKPSIEDIKRTRELFDRAHALGMTDASLAELSGITRGAVTAWRREGRSIPRGRMGSLEHAISVLEGKGRLSISTPLDPKMFEAGSHVAGLMQELFLLTGAEGERWEMLVDLLNTLVQRERDARKEEASAGISRQAD